MPEEFDNYRLLLDRLRALIRERPPRIIAVEGVMQSGKTHLAKRIGTDLQVPVISVDCFSFKSRDPQRFERLPEGLPYLQMIDVAALSDAVSTALRDRPLVVVEGICLRDALSQFDCSPDLTIYVKRLSENTHQWYLPFDIEDFEQGRSDVSRFDTDQMEYHSRSRPHELATLVFSRVETTPDEA
ncbi:hypothetical protein FRZ61_32930 [Hypericibacter adhaerens]|uniref:Uridine kinase n=1 Tax=Hypericibacter adhaerens TaxID=2602016 RepID=A0A5J6N2Y9_9PROT|nr:ATP-binding protein [Hypericibacter adhaerens]QEX23355.1 hypothetical protein FRZ61_32930 [Hypericibacter adhaerens]